jgi:hypothetical protein
LYQKAAERFSSGNEDNSVGLLGGAPKKVVKCSDSEAREKLKKLCFDAKDNIVGEVSEEAAEGAVRSVLESAWEAVPTFVLYTWLGASYN